MGYIVAKPHIKMALHRILEQLTKRYPGAKSTGDYFRTRIAHEEEIAERLGLEGHAVESTRDAAMRIGPVESFVVPIGNSLVLTGRLDEDGDVMLNANRRFTLAEVKDACACLEELGFELEVHSDETRL